MDTTTVNTLITAASGALVGLAGMYIHANQLGRRIDDLRADSNKSLDVLRGDMNRQFDKADKRFEKIDQDLTEWNKIQREQDGRITDLERKKP